MNISVTNQASVGLGIDLNLLVSVMQIFLDVYFGKIWGRSATLNISKNLPSNGAALILLDNADVADALGYHDITKNGYPIGKVFVETLLQDKQSVSVTATHELAEMILNPGCQMWAQNKNVLYAFESADAVEEDTFKINGVSVTNFVTPQYFDSFRRSGQFDYMGLLKKPFSLRPGGYSIVLKGGKVSQIFGSKDKERRFKREDRRLHRSEFCSYRK